MLITDSCAGLLSSFKLNNPARCCGPWRLWTQGVRRCHCPPCSAFPFSQARGLASPPAPLRLRQRPQKPSLFSEFRSVCSEKFLRLLHFQDHRGRLDKPFPVRPWARVSPSWALCSFPVGWPQTPATPELLDLASRLSYQGGLSAHSDCPSNSPVSLQLVQDTRLPQASQTLAGSGLRSSYAAGPLSFSQCLERCL